MPGIDVLVEKALTAEILVALIGKITQLHTDQIYACESDDDIIKCPKGVKLIIVLRKPEGEFQQLIEFWPRQKDLDVVSINFVSQLCKAGNIKCLIGDETRGPMHFNAVDQNGKVKPAKLDLQSLKNGIYRVA